MAKASQKKKLWCKKAVFQKQGSDLQALLTTALDQFRKAGQRKESIIGTNEARLISYFRQEKGALYGIMLSYEKGRNQLTLPEDDDAEMLSVEQVAPPAAEDGKRREFLDGVLYFLVHKNHVLTIQSSALRSAQFEQHLAWLLDKGGSFKGNSLALADQVSNVTRAKVRKSHAKEVWVDAPLVSATSTATDMPVTSSQVAKSFELSGLGLSWLESVIPEHLRKQLKFEDALDANLECSLRVRYKRSSTDKGHALLDNLALALRHVDDAETVIKLAGGGIIKGDEIKLSKDLSIETFNGITNPDDAFSKMHAWLSDSIRDGLIDP